MTPRTKQTTDPTQPGFNQLCSDCGKIANHMTRLRQYGAMAAVPMNQGAYGAWSGICDICGQEKTVTSVRDYFYPSERACKLLKQYIQKGEL